MGFEMIPEFLADLSSDAASALQSTLRPSQLERGGLLFHPEDRAETLYFLSRGRLRLYRIGSAAREVTVTVMEAAEMLGEVALNLDHTEYGLYAEALEDCELQAVGAQTLRTLLSNHPTLHFALTAQLIRQARALQHRFTQLVFLEVTQRLSLTLLRLADQDSEIIDKRRRLRGRISHQDLAHLVGSTRETITKLLGEFKDRGLLDLGYRRIVLLDENGLREMSVNPPSV